MRSGAKLLLVLALILWGCGQSNNNGEAGTTSHGGTVTSSSGSGGLTAGSGGVAGSSSSMGGGGTVGAGGSGSVSQGGDSAAGSKSTAGNSAAGSGGGPGGVIGSGGAAGSGGFSGTGGSTAAGGATGAGGEGVDAGRGDAATAGSGSGAKDGGGTGGSGGMTGAGGTTRNGGSTGSGGAAAGGSTSGDVSIIPDPSWACGMADGIPAPEKGQLVFSATLQIGATHDVGNTPYGHRRLLDVKGGTITGDRIKGSVVTGGLEYELTLSNGVVEFQGINILKTSDNALIYVRSCGVAPDGSATPRVVPDFEAATSGTYAWLNTGKFVATRVVNATGGTLQLDVYDVSKVTVGDPRVQIAKPSGVPKQPWDCNTTTGTKGASVFTESVSLGSSISIANAKRGSRNIIPITGGTTTGQVVGSILNGGADYQLSGSLDAWYTLAPSSGGFILVRNCGPMGKLIPWFEAPVDGPYNFLNANTFLSSDPGSSGGGVGITFYERK